MRFGPIDFQRWGSARSSPYVTGDPETLGIVVNGTYRPNTVIQGSFSATLSLGASPSTARLSVTGFIPEELNEILIYSNYASTLIFGGNIKQVSQTSSRQNGQLFYNLNCLDWASWKLRKQLVFGRYRGTSASAVFLDLVATYADVEFTTPFVMAGAPDIDIDFVGENLTQALDAVALAASTTAPWKWWVDPEQRFYFFTASPFGSPTALTPTNYAYESLVFNTDASQVRTSAYVVGKSTQVTAPAPVGQTFVDVEDSDIFIENLLADSYSFGLSGGQILRYTTVPSATRIGGIPAAGAGSIAYRLRIGDTISTGAYYQSAIWAAEIAAKEGGDGLHANIVTDGALEGLGCISRAFAEAYYYGNIAYGGSYLSYDQATRPGQSVSIVIPARAINGSYLIQQVEMSQPCPGHIDRRVQFSSALAQAQFNDVIVPKASTARRASRWPGLGR